MLCEKPGIVVACDVSSVEELAALVAALDAVEHVTAFKVGLALALRHGLPAVVEAVRRGSAKPVIYDHQKAGTDIPQMGRPFAEVCAASGVNAVILFAHAGPATLEAWIEAAQSGELTVVVGATMTHPRFLVSEGGFISDDSAGIVYDLALDRGVRHFVLPATKPQHAALLRDRTASRSSGQVVAMAPGIGRQGADVDEVRESFAGLTWSAIVGSAIYGAPDPGKAAADLASALGFGGAGGQ